MLIRRPGRAGASLPEVTLVPWSVPLRQSHEVTRAKRRHLQPKLTLVLSGQSLHGIPFPHLLQPQPLELAFMPFSLSSLGDEAQPLYCSPGSSAILVLPCLVHGEQSVLLCRTVPKVSQEQEKHLKLVGCVDRSEARPTARADILAPNSVSL